MKPLIILSLLLLMLASCGGGSNGSSDDTVVDDGSNTGTGTNNNGGGNTNSGNGNNGGASSGGNTTTELEGEWLKICGPIDPAFPADGYDIVRLTFMGDQIFTDIENYTDAACSVAFPQSPNPTATSTFTLGEVVMTSNGIDATEIDIQITEFNGAPFDEFEYDIYAIEDDNLYGGTVIGLSPEERPDTLDFIRVFVRQ
ncbi:MAG: hypothetical protein ACRBCI_13475 [Cellvibrionaceae bacterium]